MTDTTIATTIRDQIGRKSLFMLGAKDLLAGDNYLGFKIGKNSAPRVNYVKITLNSMDTYDIEFRWLTIRTNKLVSEAEGVYADMLHDALRTGTGMETHFPNIVGF